MGKFVLDKDIDISTAFSQFDLLPQYRRKSMIFRAASKICRKFAPTPYLSNKAQLYLEDRLNVIADRLAAAQLTVLLKTKPEIKIVIGYAGLSALVGQTAKAAGKKYAIHSQFCHPHVQNRLIAEAYMSINLATPPISQFRLQQQLATLELADIIWCPSKLAQQSLWDNGVSRAKTFVGYLGVDIKSFYIPEDERHQDDAFLILFVGNVGLQKGVHVLLEALSLSSLSNITIVFNGSADVTSQRLIQIYRNRLAVRNIKILVDPGDPRRYHKKASMLVLPSVHDSFGIVVLEAMAAGLPVIVSDKAGAQEVVQHEKNGYIFSAGNSNKLAEYIDCLYYNSVLRKEFGQVSKRIAKEFDVSCTSDHILAQFL